VNLKSCCGSDDLLLLGVFLFPLFPIFRPGNFQTGHS
jgi:hypothetical protein